MACVSSLEDGTHRVIDCRPMNGITHYSIIIYVFARLCPIIIVYYGLPQKLLIIL